MCGSGQATQVARHLDLIARREEAAEDGDAEGATELPMPATYVLDRSGMIRLAFIDEDYTKRLDPQEILETLRGVSK